MRSDTNRTGFEGVRLHSQGRYQAECNTPPCCYHYLGLFDTPEEAAQKYRLHWEEAHPEAGPDSEEDADYHVRIHDKEGVLAARRALNALPARSPALAAGGALGGLWQENPNFSHLAGPYCHTASDEEGEASTVSWVGHTTDTQRAAGESTLHSEQVTGIR
jgi:hypothetical protein